MAKDVGEAPRTPPPPPPAAEEVFEDLLPLAERFVELLADTGVSHGLIGPREVDRLWERHVLNCAVVAEFIPEDAEVVDVGSGAGLPGLALAIARPDVTMHLVEPMARRTDWLSLAAEDLGLPHVHVHRGRAEEVDLQGDVVTARAVSKLSTLGRWMAPLARDGAVMLALKGASAEDELARDRQATMRAGWRDLEVVHAGVGLLDPVTTVIRGVRAPDRRPATGRRARRR
ncbi:16S rRNA (guanine(527)-N(7))-methyltransferase RsmG [Mobilicoccus sp.]|uniref:16S rRNA (guanine(527)-N(7))-methyltransferase RsmG n=1 Tax=Mobilicoccus sp. TaxID=2034349 RepID=UPI0028A5B964|nr:16S rRNA (guanine(527)-N(7))-methyltransferase RsmG [Mobilicoccus sp.]